MFKKESYTYSENQKYLDYLNKVVEFYSLEEDKENKDTGTLCIKRKGIKDLIISIKYSPLFREVKSLLELISFLSYDLNRCKELNNLQSKELEKLKGELKKEKEARSNVWADALEKAKEKL